MPGKFTCAQQRAFGKCNVSFMKGFCNKTCGRCKAVKRAQPNFPPLIVAVHGSAFAHLRACAGSAQLQWVSSLVIAACTWLCW